jgi:hypothetical protein
MLDRYLWLFMALYQKSLFSRGNVVQNISNISPVLLLSLCEAQTFVIRDTKTECTSHHFHLSLDSKAMSCTTLSALEILAKAHILHAPIVGERCDDGGDGICIGATRVAVSPATFFCGTVSFTKESVMMMVVKHFAFYSSMPTTTYLLIRSLSTSVDSLSESQS